MKLIKVNKKCSIEEPFKRGSANNDQPRSEYSEDMQMFNCCLLINRQHQEEGEQEILTTTTTTTSLEGGEKISQHIIRRRKRLKMKEMKTTPRSAKKKKMKKSGEACQSELESGEIRMATRRLTKTRPLLLVGAIFVASILSALNGQYLTLADEGSQLIASASGLLANSNGANKVESLAMALVSASNEPAKKQSQSQDNSMGASLNSAASQTQLQTQLPITSTSSSSSVIIIKYANVTNQQQQQQQQLGIDQQEQQNQHQVELNVFKLFAEPLSVQVIESKFSHSIQLFDVSQNQLSTLSKDLFCPLSNEVRQLNISHNLLENFDCLGLISQAGQLCLSELKTLDMSYNLIKHLPATGVATLHNLEILNLSHNLIESLDELSLSSLFKLTKLDLSSNRIQQLPIRIFHKSTSMQLLKLQSNFLRMEINQMFLSGLTSLEEINLSHNNISHVKDFAFLDKLNLSRVDLSHNQLSGLREEAIKVTIVRQISQQGYRHRLHHNGQYAGSTPKQQIHSQTAGAEFYLSANPFTCDCQLEWMRRYQPLAANSKRTVLTPPNRMVHQQDPMQHQSSSSPNSYLNDQPSPVIQHHSSDSNNNNNISETSDQSRSSGASSSQQPTAANQHQNHIAHHSARIGDLDLIKCTPLFRRNHNNNHNHHNHHRGNHERNYLSSRLGSGSGGRALGAPSESSHHQQGASRQHLQDSSSSSSAMIDLITADSSNFLCRYKSHCFALCQCCDFDACDCEMICPNGCNCYYDLFWQTNIIDCSSSNHTVVPERIPMDVSGLYLDGNNIDSLKPSNLIARKSLKTLYLNATNLQFIANRTFNGLIELQTMYLHDNLLRTLHGYEFEPLAQLRALYLQSNRLDHISNQTFIYLRSLEILDLSNNRLISTNLDLFWSIGHQNIRLRQLSIAHNWWSCQCNSINRFRQILKQKFLLNGSVNIADRNQLRCYYNSTTVGPLILADSSSSSAGNQAAAASLSSSSAAAAAALSSSPLYASSYSSSSANGGRQQTQLTEINQCSDIIEPDQRLTQPMDFNPPLIHPLIGTEFPMLNSPEYPNDPIGQDSSQQQQQQQTSNNGNNNNPMLDQPIYSQTPGLILSGAGDTLANANQQLNNQQPAIVGTSRLSGSSGMPLSSFILLTLLLAAIMVIAISIFAFVRQQQQQRFHQSHQHQKKSSAASTTSASSSASSTAISSLNGKSSHPSQLQRQHHLSHTQNNPSHHQAHTSLLRHTATLHNNNHNHGHQQLIMNNSHSSSINHQQIHLSQHAHSASSQSNIYAALVSPTTGNSTTVTSTGPAQGGPLNQLYSNSSTTASHHSGSSQVAANPAKLWHQQSLYNQPYNNNHHLHHHHENHYSSQASYKTTGSLYNDPMAAAAAANSTCLASSCLAATLQHQHQQQQQQQQGDWIKLPKVKQFVSKLVNKSLALGGYHRACSRDELSAITSDKIYDAFISYDKQDEVFVMQHLSAELEYGQPQYRIADRYRDLPLPSSAYIAEAITSVIGCSHRTIIVLTDNYLASDWCRYELQAALQEASIDRSHKIIAVVLDPKCLLEMDAEMRSLLTNNQNATIYQAARSGQLVQLESNEQQLVATLVGNQASGGNQQVSTQVSAQLATSRITFINYNERKFWPKIKQLMPTARPSTQTLTLTTKN